LGVSAFYHDSAACLLQDGKLVAAAQEERFTRIRHDPDFPKMAIDYCLKAGGIGIKDVSAISYYEKPFLKFERILESLVINAPQSFPLAVKALPVWLRKKLWMGKTIRNALGYDIPILYCGHHEAHAASCFFPSPFQKAATLTVDGVGEWSTTTWGIGQENRITLKEEIRYPHSLGLLYSAFTQYLGFRVNSAEYKVMGLAPYGEPKYSQKIKENVIEIFSDGSFLLNMDYFSFDKRSQMISPRLEALFDKPRRDQEGPIEAFHADMARSLQDVTEEVMLKLAAHIHKQTGLKDLCLAGGVSLNCVANGRILRESPFERLWIQPGAGDCGGAIGAAYIAWHHVFEKGRAKTHKMSKLVEQVIPSASETGAEEDKQHASLLGPEYDSQTIEDSIKKFGLKYHAYSASDFYAQAAALIDDQKIVGWFQGRMEFGPRALGSRSILGDARNPEMQRRMNLKIKFRESFRPFAPSVLLEDADTFFDLAVESPYMLLTTQVKTYAVQQKKAANAASWISEKLLSVESPIPAVTHVDGSARVQTVTSSNPSFERLLKAFKKLSGTSVVINTSFNVRGEPIVCSPSDAIRCFLKTDIDALAIGHFIIFREEQDQTLIQQLREKFHEEDQFELD
jgi:carbamoyltransferase